MSKEKHQAANAKARNLHKKGQHLIDQLNDLIPEAQEVLAAGSPHVSDDEKTDYLARFDKFGKWINDGQVLLREFEVAIEVQEKAAK